MKYRFVGDIHGQINVMKQALDCDADRVIFVGDLVDSFRRSVPEQVECLDLALSLAGEGRVDVTWANHEWSYLEPSMRCSGYNAAMAAMMIDRADMIRMKFRPFIYEREILVTHAGLSNQLWEEFNLNKENFIEHLADWTHDLRSPYYDIGYARGGRAKVGGPLWCDFNHEFQPVPGLNQVFGHSRGVGIRRIEDNWCIDTLENTAPQFLDMEF
jgi:hypothetical protein